jgi:hypothetical protein
VVPRFLTRVRFHKIGIREFCGPRSKCPITGLIRTWRYNPSRSKALKPRTSFKSAWLIVLVGATTFGRSPVVRGQSASVCDEGRPFTATKTENEISLAPDGTEFKQDFRGRMVRDSGGRTYSELRTVPAQSPRTQSEAPGSDGHSEHRPRPQIDSIISISDCHSGKTTAVFPELKRARVSTNSSGWYWSRKSGVSYFEFLAGGPRPANVLFEDLGLKEVEGVLTHGYKKTVLGTEDDGEWNGKAKFVMESWISDDLAEIILQILTNLKAKSETRIMLSDVAHAEPDASLFEIPPDYEISQAP